MHSHGHSRGYVYKVMSTSNRLQHAMKLYSRPRYSFINEYRQQNAYDHQAKVIRLEQKQLNSYISMYVCMYEGGTEGGREHPSILVIELSF